MIQKLRRKFILTNMALVTLVLLIVFAALVWSTSNRLEAQSLGAMRMALEWGAGSELPPFEIRPGGPDKAELPSKQDKMGQAMVIPAFCVVLDENGAVADVRSRESITVSDETLEQAVSEVRASNAPTGTLRTLGLRYLISAEPNAAARIAFADRSWERENLRSLVLASLLIGMGALLCFFLISLFLSKIATRPVEKAWEQQRQFVADASHELKTPLTVVLANAGILLAHPNDTVARQAKWVEYIQEEAGRMKTLVEDMLFLAKSDAARSALPKAAVDMSEVTEGCLLPFESVAFEAGVELTGNIPPGLRVRGDVAQLRRLVYILLDNACKYAGKGGRVEVRLSWVQEKLRLAVCNTGPAIPPEHLPHLFERFYRSDSARSREAGGYGLGLAIAKSIVDAHGGKITVESDSASGTKFMVIFPGCGYCA